MLSDAEWEAIHGSLTGHPRVYVGDPTLVSSALKMALQQRRPCKGLILHSDRGSQYASHEYQNPEISRKLEGVRIFV